MSRAAVYEGDVGEEQLLDGGAVGQRLDHLGQTNISTPILAEVSKMERNNDVNIHKINGSRYTENAQNHRYYGEFL